MYTARMAVPAVAAVAVTVAVLALRYHRQLTGRYQVGQRPVIQDRAVFTVAALACLMLGPAVLTGVPPWAAAGIGAVALSAVFAVRRRETLRGALVPWRLVLLVVGLFLVVTAAGEHGLDAILAHAVGTSNSGWAVIRTAGVGAGTANVLNNLPAYLALERAIPADNTEQLLGLLIGVNASPLILIWGSLATLLWRERCQAQDLNVTTREFATVGLLGMPLVVAATAATLAITS